MSAFLDVDVICDSRVDSLHVQLSPNRVTLLENLTRPIAYGLDVPDLHAIRSTFSSGRAKNDSVVDRGFSSVVRVRIAASDDPSSEGRLDSNASRTNQVNAGVSSSAPRCSIGAGAKTIACPLCI